MKKPSMVTPQIGVVAGVVFSLTASSCGMFKKKSTDNSSPATIETVQGETIALTGTLNFKSETTASMSLLGTPSLNLTSPAYTLSCNALSSSSNEVVPVTADIGTDGSFSVSMAAAKTALGCVVKNSAGADVASFAFKDSNQKDFAGNDKITERASLKTDVALGTLDADLALAQVSVDTSSISEQLGTATVTTPFLFDGAWVINKATSLPSGYTDPCTTAEQAAARESNGNSCNGPGAGEKIWIKTLTGKDTTTGDPKYGIMVWTNESAFTSCGSKLGFTYDDAKANAGIDLTGSGIAEGSFSWATGWTDGWKNTSLAKAQYMDMNCLPATFTNPSTGGTFEANKCTDAAGNYSINLAGGCFTTADSQPVRIMNWSGVTDTTSTQSTDTLSGLPKNIMSGTYDGKAVRCISINQNYNADGSLYVGHEPIRAVTLVNQGDLCSAINTSTTAGAMAQMRCYANYYQQNSNSSSADSVCLRKLQMDWTTTDPAKFVSQDGPQLTTGQDVLALLDYVDDNTASFTNDEIRFEGVQSNSMWINCKMHNSFTMTLRRQSDSIATGEFVNTAKLVDTDKAACVAQYGTSARTMKLFMEFDKQ